ncbi:hypothetical protein BLS_001539 [Venturia inaequalis]|uniref:FAD-binding domain-containing protein n=1 Tax=Venturia inaequalis TaxID=5025 RepID=A0A8H3U0L5_VENIN|nr:hypothetical protein BLS_001539 [Venturia inaequalis]
MPVGSYPSTGIEVLIIGTGPAGITAAIECVRKGHKVRVLERNKTEINTGGDIFFLGRSATQFLVHWPELAREYDSVSLRNAWIETLKHSGEQMVKPMRASDRLRAQGLDPDTPSPGNIQMRPVIYQILLNQLKRLGIKVEYGQQVTEYFESKDYTRAGVITRGGQTCEADIVIAADGIGSVSQRIVGGRELKAKSSGRAMWRAKFPIHHLDRNPGVKQYFEMAGDKGDEPILRFFFGPSTYALTLSLSDTIVWALNHDTTGSEAESWNNTIQKEEVLATIDRKTGTQKWAQVLKDLVDCTPPDTIINLPLLWRNPQPSWTSPGARIVQIGDSAHAFHPAAGTGAAQAMEDAITIASCLQIGGKDSIQQSVKTHVMLRFVRTACAQKVGLFNADLMQDADWNKVEISPSRAMPKLPAWNFSHNPERYTYENYDKVVEGICSGAKYITDLDIPPNYPPGYTYEPWDVEQVMSDRLSGNALVLEPGQWD